MLKVSKGAVAAVMEKAYQKNPEDFIEDFMEELRLENKAVHELTVGFLKGFVDEVGGEEAEVEVVKCVTSGEEVFEFIAEKNRDRKALAKKGCCLAIGILGLFYKSLKAEIEARDLEYPETTN